MQISEFRSKIKPGAIVEIEDKKLETKQVIKFKFDDGNLYIKCFLSDDYVFADDMERNVFLLVKEVKTPFEEPFTKELEFQGEFFKFLYTAHAVAEESWGEQIFKKGEGERFWDYESKNGSYLSLGIKDSTKERLDFFGEIVPFEKVNIK